MPEWALRAPLRPTAIASALDASGDLQSVNPLTTATLSGPSTAQTGIAVTYTVTLNAAANQTYVVTPSCPGATVSPGSFNITAGNSAGNFTVTAPSDGGYSVDFTISPTLTRANRPITLTAATSPITLAFDEATPHQISVRAVQSRALASGTTAALSYRVTGVGSYIDAMPLYRVQTSEGGLAADAGFAGPIIGLDPGITYDVRVDLTEPGVGSWQLDTTHTTRALPAENASPSGSGSSKSANTSNWTTVLAGAVAGDVITLANGSYTTAGLSFTSPGTAANPVTIRGASRAGVTIDDTSSQPTFDILLSLSGSYCTIENITFLGSGTDGGADAPSQAISWSGGNGMTKNYWTIRHCTFDGFDRAIKTYEPIKGLLVYDCEFLGNNPYQVTVDDTGAGWNDDGCDISGHGNCVWNCTFEGHGDVIKMGLGGSQSAFADSMRSRANYVHHCWIKWSADDGCEFDESAGNVGFYDNIVTNSADSFSCDGIYGGPVVVVRNLFINHIRYPLKLTSVSQGVRVYNNTFVETTKKSGHDYGYLQATGSTNYGLDWRNNLLTYRGSGALIHANSSTSLPNFDAANNAWYASNQGIQWATSLGSYASVAAAKTGMAPVMRNDIVLSSSDPFASAITLGASYTTQYTGHVDATLAAGNSARNAGMALPGVTDGFTGAAPDIGCEISGRSRGTIGCSWNNQMPSWAANATINAWAQISGTNLSAITYDPLPAGNIARKVDAWCSMSLDTRTSRLYQAAGGGHTDYAGNEVEVLDLTKESPAWATLLAPSASQQNGSYYSDGRPTSRHNYHGSHVNEFDNRIMLFGGAQYSSGAILNTVDSFNLSGNSYNAASTHPNIPSGIVGAEVRPTCMDPRNGDVYIFGGSSSSNIASVVKWTRSTNTMGSVTSLGGGAADREACACWDSTRNVIVMIYGNTMRTYNPASGVFSSATITGATITSPGSFEGNSTVYVPALDAFLHYLGTGGGTVYSINASTLVATNLSTTGGSSIPSGAHGSWGRFRYVPQLHGVVYVPTHASNAWFLRVH